MSFFPPYYFDEDICKKHNWAGPGCPGCYQEITDKFAKDFADWIAKRGHIPRWDGKWEVRHYNKTSTDWFEIKTTEQLLEDYKNGY